MLNHVKKRHRLLFSKDRNTFEQDAYEQALNGDSIGYVGFLKVADEYSGTKAANLAKSLCRNFATHN